LIVGEKALYMKNTCIDSDIFYTSISDYYDWFLECNTENGHISTFHFSKFFMENGFIPESIHTFDQLNQLFVEKLVVSEEAEAYLSETKLSNILKEINQIGSFVLTVHIDTPAGIRAESLRIKPIENRTNRILVRLTDITMILDRDWMTDIYSRSGFLAKVEQLLMDPAYQTGYSIVYTNIQGFKAINDILGTQHGDLIIFEERDALIEVLNPTIIARLEDEHFALFVKTENLTETNLEKLCHQYHIQGTKRIPLLIHFGIYNITDPSKNVPRMLDQAKLAEKSIPASHGVPYAVCNEKLSQDYVNQRIFVSELDNALKKGEFLPYFQPIVDAKTGDIVSAEALIRWNHSERGMIPPIQFIPLFEKEGLSTKLDSFMLNSILDFNHERMKNGKKIVPCAVNLSRADFYDTKFLGVLKQKLENLTNVHEMLKLEITESAYAFLESDALVLLEKLRKAKLSFSLDDFGSGMSSLSTLELFDFDTIKLDMGFIRKIGINPRVESIIHHTIGMAHDMGAKVVAEGVETKEQLEFLQSVDCDMIQGYYFYKPMPAEEFIKLL
jgi:EAL domain-containing protein (putative c-di-GMP-specific phosphodiesterase class I)